MSQISSPNSTAPSTPGYSPLLKAVLGSLDLQLEEELARYRRQRSAKGFSARSKERSPGQKTLDLISVRATGGRTQPESDPVPKPELLAASAIGSDPVADRIETEIPPLGIALDRTFPADNSPGLVSPDTSPTNSVPVIPTVVHNDYLESSEALQKNLDAPKAPAESESSFTDNLLTPLGIGSMLLLLLSSATLGYVAMNPNSLSHLPFKTLFGQKRATETKNAALPASNNPGKSTGTSIAQTPNLASKEFVDLNLRSLSNIDPKISPVPQTLATPSSQLPVKAPAPLPNPVASPIPLDLPSALLPPSVQSGVLPQLKTQPSLTQAPGQKPAANQPDDRKKTEAVARFAPGKSATPNQPAAKSTPPKENKFLVVTIYDGDRSLAEVRKVVPDASVRRLKASTAIQISAFPSEAEAQRKVENLRKQGISAQVYRL